MTLAAGSEVLSSAGPRRASIVRPADDKMPTVRSDGCSHPFPSAARGAPRLSRSARAHGSNGPSSPLRGAVTSADR